VIDEAGNSWQSQPHGCGERLSTFSHPALGSGDRFKWFTDLADAYATKAKRTISNRLSIFIVLPDSPKKMLRRSEPRLSSFFISHKC